MAFERLLRLTHKFPGYVVSVLRNASVGIATVTQESFESQYYITQALFGTRSLFAMTAPVVIILQTGLQNNVSNFYFGYTQRNWLNILKPHIRERSSYLNIIEQHRSVRA